MHNFYLKKNNPNEPREEVSFGEQARDFIVELFKVVMISLAIIIPVRYFLIQPFYVKGMSMDPTFKDHEYLIIDEISYRFKAPNRGDVVVFRYPYDTSEFFIKRIIGLPNESVKIEDGRIFIQEPGKTSWQEITETYLPNFIYTNLTSAQQETWKLKSDEYFVLGDNRGSSKDSREFGTVAKSYLVGRVWFRGWPFNRITLFSAPQYNIN